MIAVGFSNGKGRGVFAEKPFNKGELIEKAPVIVIPGSQGDLANKTILFNYSYEWGTDLAIALGHGSLYNHSYTPNAVFIKKPEEMRIDFVALRDINVHEEITINYNNCSDDLSPLWFEVLP